MNKGVQHITKMVEYIIKNFISLKTAVELLLRYFQIFTINITRFIRSKVIRIERGVKKNMIVKFFPLISSLLI